VLLHLTREVHAYSAEILPGSGIADHLAACFSRSPDRSYLSPQAALDADTLVLQTRTRITSRLCKPSAVSRPGRLTQSGRQVSQLPYRVIRRRPPGALHGPCGTGASTLRSL